MELLGHDVQQAAGNENDLHNRLAGEHLLHFGMVGQKMLASKTIEIAVKGMLPKGPLGRAMFRKLKVYAGNEHNHAAQQPQVLDI